MSNNISILIIEDNKLIKAGIKSLFENENGYTVIGEADSGKEALKIAEESKPNVILLDLGLPDTDGTRLITKLHEKSEFSRIIVLTAHDNEEEIKKCISEGVYAYIIKDINVETLLKVVQTVNSGAMWFDPKIVPVLRNSNTDLKNKTSPKVFKSNHSNLTQREFEVLKLIVDGKSNSDIAQELCISEHTAKAHVCNIIQKLVVDDRTQAAVKALKEGIIQ